jgi:hypothetical protein
MKKTEVFFNAYPYADVSVFVPKGGRYVFDLLIETEDATIHLHDFHCDLLDTFQKEFGKWKTGFDLVEEDEDETD